MTWFLLIFGGLLILVNSIDLLRPTPKWDKNPGTTRAKEMGLVGLGIVFVLIAMMDLQNRPEPAARAKTPDHDPVTAYTMCHEFVKDELVSPGAAKFPLRSTAEFVTYTGGSSYKIENWVDSPNQNGVLIRTNFLCAITRTSDGQWRLDNLEMKSSGSGATRPRP